MPRRDINVMMIKLIRGGNIKNPSNRYTSVVMRLLWLQLTKYYSDNESPGLKKFDEKAAEPLFSRNFWQLLPAKRGAMQNQKLDMDE